MRRLTRSAKTAGLAFALLFHLAGIATAAAIPAKAALDPKVLWRMVMEGYYGPYDRALKCWTARIGTDHVCMRPHRLDAVSIRGTNHLFLVIGGTRLGDDGQPQEAHVDSGMLGLIVLRQDGGTLKLVAKNDLHTPFGSFGNVPSEDSFAVREIGPDDTYGWVATDGWMGQGHLLTSATIFAPVGDTVANIGNIPDHYDNSGNCENGKVMGSDVACTDYSAELIFDSADRSSRFYPIIVKVRGSREGVTIDQTFTTRFDTGKFAYPRIEGLPEEFANGI
jgi:hypothetical protein